MKLLEGKVAIVTGSTKGNGKAIAELFSQNGANVVITGRNLDEAYKVANEIVLKFNTNPLPLQVDVSKSTDVSVLVMDTVKKYGRVDILVNNAGYPINDFMWESQFSEIRENEVNAVFDVDTLGTFRCCKEILPIMVKQEFGVIINISSTPAVGGYDKGAPYTVAKAANLGITKHIAKEYGKFGIRCNTIAPGTIATKRNWERLSEEEKKKLISTIPLGRPGKPEDIAGVALVLASDYTSFVNGQTIVVDGGELTF